MVDQANKESYVAKFEEHVRDAGVADAAKLHIGGIDDYDIVGFVAAELLKRHVIEPEGFLVDVGCGSGRVARYLSDLPNLRYLGTEVVGKLLDVARDQVGRPDWRFEEIDDLVIPVVNGSADAVCFFSVLTHLLHEQSFAYLAEAARAVKRGGKIAFTFLDFAEPRHRDHFLQLVETRNERTVLSVFMDMPAIEFWAEALKLDIEFLAPASRPAVTGVTDVTLKNGIKIEGDFNLGHSFCVLRKR